MPALLRRLALGLVLASSAISLAACDTKDYGPIKALQALQALPESHLPPFPGATLLSQGSSPRVDDPLEGTYGASVGRRFGTDADFVTVLKYYDGLLTPLGWNGCFDWHKGGYRFSISEVGTAAMPSSEQGYKLVFNEDLSEDISVQPSGPQPSFWSCGPYPAIPSPSATSGGS